MIEKLLLTPYNFQIKARDYLLQNSHSAIFGEPGVGKTIISLSYIKHIRRPALVIAPLHLIYSTWPEEIELWKNFSSLTYNIIHGPNKLEAFRSAKRYNISLINPEGVLWLIDQIKKDRVMPWHILLVDESAKFKSPSSKRFKKIKPLMKYFLRRHILAGNPLPNNYFDLWAQYYMVDVGSRLGTSFYSYRQKYFFPTDFKRFSWDLFPGAEDTIKEKVAPISLYIPIEGNVEMPPRRFVDVHIDLPSAIRVQYNKMAKSLKYEIDHGSLDYISKSIKQGKFDPDLYDTDVGVYEGDSLKNTDSTEILAPSKGAATMKCWQIANGHIFESLTKLEKLQKKNPKSRILHKEKVKATLTLVEDIQPSPVMIGFIFKNDYRLLREAFPSATLLSVPDKAMAANIAVQWNNNEIPIMLAQMTSVSHGYNLQKGKGHHIILFSLCPNFDTVDQFIRRIWRQSVASDKVIIHRILAKKTIDDKMLTRLREKKTTSENFLKGMTR